jgi:hypothetical protein
MSVGHASVSRAGRSIRTAGVKQVELHPCHVVPAVVLPCNAAVQARVLEPEGSMEANAGLVGLSDSGEDLPVAALGEPLEQLCVELASAAGAMMGAVDVDTRLSRPLEGSQPLQCLTARKADDLIISLEYEPKVSGRIWN